jgi:DNA processing protein
MFDAGWLRSRRAVATRRLAAVLDPEVRDRAALIALLRERPGGWTWPQIAFEVSQGGSAEAVLEEMCPRDLFACGTDSRIVAAAADIASWRANGVECLAFYDERYPAQLRDIHEMPPVIFYRGELAVNEQAVSVVGSGAASARGLDIARNVAAELARRQVTVVSGLARGVDTAAHQAVLEQRGRTVAVLGCGINRYYPAENRDLQERIARAGLVISQFWPDAAPRQQQFPMRNAVMSGYGRATIVIEASEKSGARIQARQAVAHGRPVILTDLVISANTWARQLLDRPSVYVATGTADAMKLVDEILSADSEIDYLLAHSQR